MIDSALCPSVLYGRLNMCDLRDEMRDFRHCYAPVAVAAARGHRMGVRGKKV